MMLGCNPYLLNRLGLLPTCAVCRKPVESMSVNPHDCGDRVRFTVACHGAKDECVIAGEVFIRALSVKPGLAFNAGGEVLPL